jgi:nicotinate-nucleotide--dimethylbenzimidazole phosphoribosyltransferase
VATSSAPPGSFGEIRALIEKLPAGDEHARREARARESQLAKPPGSLGRLEEIAEWLATWQGRHPPTVDHPRISIFAGNHGIAALGVSAQPPSYTEESVKSLVAGDGAINQICRVVDADLRIYEMALEEPTADFTRGPALGEALCVRALAYGMMAIEPGIDLLCVGEIGVGNTTAAAAIACALFGGEASDWIGPGPGSDDEGFKRKQQVVTAGLARHRGIIGDPLQALSCLGGHELAGVAGAVLAARFAHVPVLLDGFTSTVAAAVLEALKPGILDHCQIGQLSTGPGHRRVCERLGKAPLLDLGIHLGAGTGAAMAVAIVRAAVACHNGMTTRVVS